MVGQAGSEILPDPDAVGNSLVVKREPLESFTRFFD
jgi:hypothetical protein